MNTYSMQESNNDTVEIKNCFLNKFDTNNIKARNHTSNMMFSHIFMVIPCLWWIYIDKPKTDNVILYSKLMAIIMTAAIVFSYLYHYYYETILCSAENTYMVFAIICLNIYMYIHGVSVLYILLGFILLFILNKSVSYCNSKTIEFYETYHPYCHYIAGLYIWYCVWNLQNVQDITNVIFNDAGSGMNYHTLSSESCANNIIAQKD